MQPYAVVLTFSLKSLAVLPTNATAGPANQRLHECPGTTGVTPTNCRVPFMSRGTDASTDRPTARVCGRRFLCSRCMQPLMRCAAHRCMCVRRTHQTCSLALATTCSRLCREVWPLRRACLNAHAVPAGVITDAVVAKGMVVNSLMCKTDNVWQNGRVNREESRAKRRDDPSPKISLTTRTCFRVFVR